MLSAVEASLSSASQKFKHYHCVKPHFIRELNEEEAYRTAAFMEKLVVGLGSLGRHYHDNDEDLAWGLLYMFTPKLVNEAAEVRRILFSKYNAQIAEGEDLDELEKLFEGLVYRKVPTPKQLARFRENRLKKQK